MKKNSDEQEDHSDKSNRLLSDLALTRRQSRSLYRNWAVISKKSTGNTLQCPTNVFSKISTSCIINDWGEHNKEYSSTIIEDRADEIVRHLEQSHSFMVDNAKLNNKIETLREMTEYLTVKRSVKRKLIKPMGSTNKILDFSKRPKYTISIFLFKIPVAMKHFLSSFELWYSSLKVIEGHFGSNVSSYFKFLRKLFLLNACIFSLMFFFVMTPQLLFRFIQYVENSQNFYSALRNDRISNETHMSFHQYKEFSPAPHILLKANPYQENGEFRLGNVFTGEGFLTNTILFYGYYTNTSLKLIEGYSFNIPASYIFTCTVCYVIIFFFLFISVAVSYRKCYIEASGGMHNTFTNKVFCGWDFGIATKEAAELKSKSIYIEIKELLDDITKPAKRKTCVSTLYSAAISFSLNGLLLFLLVVGGMYSWKYLDQQMTKADTATTMMTWLVLTLVIAIAPVLFSFITHIEGFESPSTALYMTLIRTFTLYAVVIAVVVAYRLNRSAEFECWETILGQDMFRLVVLDFIFGSVGTALSEFIRYRIFMKMWKGIGCPEFDIARSTMNLVYNQTLFYIGLYFSPVLSLLITIKLFVIFYVKKWGAIYNCRPFVKPWKAVQAHTVYLSIAFLAFFCVLIAYGYIITSVKTSNCGPFRGEKFMYESILEEVLSHENSTILTAFYYITRPGVVGIALMAMLLGVYYMRAVALARIHVVKHLQHLLRLKAEDRKLLLNEISKYTKKRDSPTDASSKDLPDLRYRSFTFKSSKSEKNSPTEKENQKRLQNSDVFEKSDLIFSSSNKLQCATESHERNWASPSSILNSIPNLSSSNLQKPVESNYKFYDNSAIHNENIFNVDLAGNSDCELNIKKDSSKGRTSRSPSVVSKNLIHVIPNEDQNTVFGNISQLNFNPVFTESVSFYSDEGEYVDDNNTKTVVKRFPDLRKKEKSSTNQSVSATSQNRYTPDYVKKEERMPSRINFILQRNTSARKKN